MSLKNYEKEIKLLQQHQNQNQIFINNEKLMHLSGTESGYEIIEAFNKDIQKNVAVIKAIVNLMNNQDEINDINIDINEIPLVKNGFLDDFKKENDRYITNQKYLTDKIKKLLYEEFFGEENKELIKTFHSYNSKKILKIIYDASDVFEFIKYTTHRVKTDKIAEQILKEKYRRIEAWEQNHYFDIYNNIYSGRIATVYMEKKESTVLKRNKENKFEIEKNPAKLKIDKEFINLLNETTSIHSIEIDEKTDINKLKKILIEMNQFKPKIDKSFYFKIRLLGKHKAAGLYYSDFDIVAIDLENDYALAHEWTHHIHLNGGITKEEEFKIYSSFNKYNSYQNLTDTQIAYYSSEKEVIARAGEFSYALYKANFEELFEKYKKNEINEEELKKQILKNSKKNEMSLSLNSYMEQSNVYFDLLERTPEELLEFYIYFQNIFQYEKKLEKEKNQNKTNFTEKVQNSRRTPRTRRKRRYLKGIESYSIKDIQDILKEYKKGNINAMLKEDLLTEVLLSEDFRQTYQLIKTFSNKVWFEEGLYKEEEIEKIIQNIINRIIEENSINEKTYLLKLIIDKIPKKYYKKLNILTIEEIIDGKEILKNYSKFKENKLLIEPLEEGIDTETFEKYINFFKQMKKIGDSLSSIAVPISDLKINKDATINQSEEMINLNQLMITYTKDNYYLPTKENQAYKIEKNNYPFSLRIRYEDIKKYIEKENENEFYAEINFKDNPELKKLIPDFRNPELIYINKKTKELHAFSKIPQKVDFEIIEKTKEIKINNKIEEGYFAKIIETAYKENEIIYTTGKIYNFKHHLKPSINYNSKDFFTNEQIITYLKNLEYEEALKRIKKVFELFSATKIEEFISYKELSELKEEYGIKIIKEIENIYLKKIIEGEEYEKKVINSYEKKEFINYILNIENLYRVKYLNLNYINQLKKEKIGINQLLKELEEQISGFEKNEEEIIKKIKIKFQKYDEEEKENEEYQKIKKEIIKKFQNKEIEIIKRKYEIIKKQIEMKIEEELNNFWKYIEKEENKKIEKIEKNKIKEYAKKYQFEDEKIKETILNLKESKAKRKEIEIVKEVKQKINTYIGKKYKVGNKNIFDYLDNNGKYTRASKEGIKEEDYKEIYEENTFNEIKELLELIKMNNKRNGIQEGQTNVYQTSFTLLEKSLEKILLKENNFKKKIKEEEKEISEDIKNEKEIIEKIEKEILFCEKELFSGEEIKKINISSKKHKEKILNKIENKLQKIFEEIIELNSDKVRKELNQKNLKYEIKNQKEFRQKKGEEKIKIYIKNLIAIKIKTLISKLNKKNNEKSTKSAITP